jgi:hypothetical protein
MIVGQMLKHCKTAIVTSPSETVVINQVEQIHPPSKESSGPVLTYSEQLT